MPRTSLSSRLLWFVGLWLAGVVTITIVGGIIKIWLGA
ncbi:hypothetical protein PDO_4966 [Rhizobium sp. PDO1-076]|nr:hypothetical protein PDO_4966 [Rhizobium sp. PDO1-076]